MSAQRNRTLRDGIFTERVRQLEELAISKLKRHNDASRTVLVIAGARVKEWGC